MIANDTADWRDGDILAVIPARDEAVRLPAALAPLHAAGVRVLVIANGCRDGTAEVARSHGATVLETVARPGGVGAARREGMAMALTLVPQPEMILTTDADCTFAPMTLRSLRTALRQADAVFGRVEPDPAEFACLPLPVRLHGQLEDRYDALVAQIEGMRADLPWDPLPRHNQSPGALIAFRPDIYRATGGIEPVPCHEDRNMAEALVRIGARIARPWDAVVQASCRLTGRAPGGMAATIAKRTRSDLSEETRRLRMQCLRLERAISDAGRSQSGTGDLVGQPLRSARMSG
ncbi:MAG: glycosyltransferase [Jannaschia sp.]